MPFVVKVPSVLLRTQDSFSVKLPTALYLLRLPITGPASKGKPGPRPRLIGKQVFRGSTSEIVRNWNPVRLRRPCGGESLPARTVSARTSVRLSREKILHHASHNYDGSVPRTNLRETGAQC